MAGGPSGDRLPVLGNPSLSAGHSLGVPSLHPPQLGTEMSSPRSWFSNSSPNRTGERRLADDGAEDQGPGGTRGGSRGRSRAVYLSAWANCRNKQPWVPAAQHGASSSRSHVDTGDRLCPAGSFRAPGPFQLVALLSSGPRCPLHSTSWWGKSLEACMERFHGPGLESPCLAPPTPIPPHPRVCTQSRGPASPQRSLAHVG